MLYFIFTVDGDWKEYFNVNLPEDERVPRTGVMQSLIEQEIEVARRNLNGKFIHFIHTSARARTFFLNEPFTGYWRQIIEDGGDIGIHCHEDDPYRAYYFHDIPRMRDAISKQVTILRRHGLSVCAYRSGWLAFSSDLIPVLEENGLCFDFSCEPERYLVDGQNLVSDWRGAPTSLYRMSYHNHRETGDSRVFEIPIGVSGGQYLYFEKSDARTIEEAAYNLKAESAKINRDIIVSVLTHSYEYASLDKIRSIEEKISLLKKYGYFINIKELKNKVESRE